MVAGRKKLYFRKSFKIHFKTNRTDSNIKMEMGFNCKRANSGYFPKHTEEMFLAA